MDKREAVLSLLDPSKTPQYVPAGFFLHFDPRYHAGQAAVEKHLEFFRYTGMDFVKIQYERTFPPLPEIRRAEDWTKMPFYGPDFYEPQLQAVKGLVAAAKAEALVVVTLYSPFMCAMHTVGEQVLVEHMSQNPEAVRQGMQTITDSLLGFVGECVHLGVDGFYASTQGGEAGRLPDRALFETCIRPYDLAIMSEIKRACPFNILHVCDYQAKYDDLSPFLDYPGQVVNTSLELAGGWKVTAREVAQMFGRPFMGGMDRLGVIARGSPEQIRQVVRQALEAAPERFILAADCTVPSDTPWDNLRLAISLAHEGGVEGSFAKSP
jgi:uroporphyrinogen decarboxylase